MLGQAGQKLAEIKIVSHCYQRKTFASWPYNLFAMMHGRSMTDIRRVVDRFVKAEGIGEWELLETVRGLLRHKGAKVF
jgi:DNA-binding Lrp family transcriptional regulator